MKKNQQRLARMSVMLLVSLFFSCVTVQAAASYPALDNVDDVKAVFDVRGKNIKPLALQLDLIHKTFHDTNIRSVDEKPQVAVVFGGGAVRLISAQRDGIEGDEKKLLDMIAAKLLEMERDGIVLEVCLFAANVHGVAPGTFPEQIRQVDNGWISLIGYQQKGYSLVAVF